MNKLIKTILYLLILILILSGIFGGGYWVGKRKCNQQLNDSTVTYIDSNINHTPISWTKWYPSQSIDSIKISIRDSVKYNIKEKDSVIYNVQTKDTTIYITDVINDYLTRKSFEGEYEFGNYTTNYFGTVYMNRLESIKFKSTPKTLPSTKDWELWGRLGLIYTSKPQLNFGAEYKKDNWGLGLDVGKEHLLINYSHKIF